MQMQVPRETQLLAHGYIREQNGKYPTEMILLIAAFYNANDDQWNEKQKGPNIEVNGMRIRYNKKRSGWQTIYGTTTCRGPFIYHWKILIKNIPQNRIFLGVANIYETVLNRIFTAGNYGFYAVNSGGCRCENGQMTDKWWCRNVQIHSSDVVEMILDLGENTLRFQINGVEQESMATSNIRQAEYNLVVGAYNHDLQITLLSSYCIKPI